MSERFERAAPWALAVAIAVSTALLPTTAGPARAQDGESPAGGVAQVVAHGVVAMPADEVAWRAYEAEAGPLADAAPAPGTSPAFFVGSDDPLVLDVDGDRAVLADGRAALVRAGDEIAFGAVDGDGAAYTLLDLGPAEVVAGNAVPVVESDPFDAPGGEGAELQVDLVRATLDEGDRAEVAEGAAGVFVLVTDGEAELRDDLDRDEPEVLDDGDGGRYDDGDVTLVAEQDGTVVLAAVIGDELPGTGGDPDPDDPGPTATPADATGAIEITYQVCAPGITADLVSDTACPAAAPAPDSLQLLTFDATEHVGSRSVADLEPGPTGLIWTSLELRTHVLQVFASGGESTYVAETDQVAVIPGPQYEVTPAEEAPYALVPVYLLTEEIPEEEVSTVTVTFLGCEAGQDAEVFLPERCYDPVPGSAAIANAGSGFYLGPDQAVPNDDGSLTWTYLGYDRFAAVDVVLPDGYVAYAQPEPVVFTTPDAPDAYLYLYFFLPLEG